jgi:hypothetical protein
VTGQDFAAFSSIEGRKVFKLHGSVNNVGSIIATAEDYQRCYRELATGLVGANLKLLLASKTILFAGYSFEDEDFLRLLQLLQREVGDLLPRSFVVTLDDQASSKLKRLHLDATPILTDATFFLERVKLGLVKEKLMLPDKIFHGIPQALNRVHQEHAKLTALGVKNHVGAFYSFAYQDGLKHAFEDILGRKNSGAFSDLHRVAHRLLPSYVKLEKQRLRRRDYWDAAYIRGFVNGLIFFLAEPENRKTLPLYFVFGPEEVPTFKEFVKRSDDVKNLHKSALKYASDVIEATVPSNEIVPHHSPFVDTSME